MSELEDTAVAAVATASDWIQLYHDKHQRVYWKNTKTGQNAWKKPDPTESATSPTVTDNLDNYTNGNDNTDGVGNNCGNSVGNSVGDDNNSGDVEKKEDYLRGWTELYSNKYQRKYWRNSESDEVSWTDPSTPDAKIISRSKSSTPMRTASAASVDGVGWNNSYNASYSGSKGGDNFIWQQKFSEKYQRTYWKNTVTGETSWSNPLSSASNADSGGISVTISPSLSQSISVSRSTATTPLRRTSLFKEVTDSDEWQEKFSEKYNKRYWKHSQTGEVSWKPLKQIPGSDTSQDATAPAENENYELNNCSETPAELGKNTFSTPQKVPPTEDSETTSSVTHSSPSSRTARLIKESDQEINTPEKWEEHYSEQYKRKYWIHADSGKTRWTPVTRRTSYERRTNGDMVDLQWRDMKNKVIDSPSQTSSARKILLPGDSADLSTNLVDSPTPAAMRLDWSSAGNRLTPLSNFATKVELVRTKKFTVDGNSTSAAKYDSSLADFPVLPGSSSDFNAYLDIGTDEDTSHGSKRSFKTDRKEEVEYSQHVNSSKSIGIIAIIFLMLVVIGHWAMSRGLIIISATPRSPLGVSIEVVKLEAFQKQVADTIQCVKMKVQNSSAICWVSETIQEETRREIDDKTAKDFASKSDSLDGNIARSQPVIGKVGSRIAADRPTADDESSSNILKIDQRRGATNSNVIDNGLISSKGESDSPKKRKFGERLGNAVKNVFGRFRRKNDKF